MPDVSFVRANHLPDSGTGTENTEVGQRLAAVLDELGVGRAHFATGADTSPISALDRVSPDRIASLAVLTPSVIDPGALGRHAEHLLGIFGLPRSAGQEGARSFIEGLAGARTIHLPDQYTAAPGSDLVADNPELFIRAVSVLVEATEVPKVALNGRTGSLHGITFEAVGDGPPLVLLPADLAPHQWAPLLKKLSERYCLVKLGGRHLPPVSFLEGRTGYSGYARMIRALFADLAITAGDSVLEVGCGTGVLVRGLAELTGERNAITAVDLSSYLLAEARAIAAEDGYESVINFQHGDATALPFGDNSFDVAFSVTVFEECDGEKATAELARVVRPGGRAGIIVRAVDLPEYWHLDLSDAVAAKVNVFPTWGVSPSGYSDGNLYRRFIRAGFSDVQALPTWARYPPIPLVRDGVVASLSEPERGEFVSALDEATLRGEGWVSKPFHCVVGTRA